MVSNIKTVFEDKDVRFEQSNHVKWSNLHGKMDRKMPSLKGSLSLEQKKSVRWIVPLKWK